jgi:replicative DNA helicase
MQHTPQDQFVAVEIEQQILGAVLLDNDLYHRVSSMVSMERFAEPVHADIWRLISARIERDHLASPVTLRQDMENHEGLRQLGGPAYLVRLAGAAISPRALMDYAREFNTSWQKRRILQAIEDARGRITGENGLEEARSVLEQILVSLPDADGRSNNVSFLRAVTDAVGQMLSAYQGAIPSLQTGIRAIDANTGGLWPADYVVIGGRPSMGKTALATDIAARVAEQGKRVVIASMEMLESSIASRILAAKANVVYSDARKGSISEADFRRIVEKAKAMENLPIGFLPPHVRDIAAVYAGAKAERARMGGLDLVIIDYLQLVRATGQFKGRYELVTEVSQRIKSMAKMLNVPIIALSQLSRNVETRDDKRPTLSDLRETGQIEQDADLIMFTYRAEYYLEREKPGDNAKPGEFADWHEAFQKSKNRMELIGAKQRNGGMFHTKIGCHLPTNRFWDLEEQQGMEF